MNKKHKKKVLLIDDEEDFCFFVKLNLQKAGKYQVFTATSGKDGIELVKQLKPDLILLDIMMPNMSGGQVAEILLEDESTSRIPIIFVTAAIEEEEVEKHMGRIGGRDFIAKPVTVEKLIEKIEKYCAV